ncbi:hypothetical protein QE400_000505 [Xanthomonas sacchari]|uniref:Imm31 family immunity protein n=1 Tax=Xanthomonas sacchari TaxID=56458 RepID=UPI0020C5A869|nr:Imm31 family immunity protein [Xanthomonas sacchari]MDQ1091092.1 hypothetical protein [Xanthomonas sacchari]
MTEEKFEFYQEVEVRAGLDLEYQGKKGVVMGVSEEDGVVYGYAVLIHGHEAVVYFDKRKLIPTGNLFSREDFYEK